LIRTSSVQQHEQDSDLISERDMERCARNSKETLRVVVPCCTRWSRYPRQAQMMTRSTCLDAPCKMVRLNLFELLSVHLQLIIHRAETLTKTSSGQ
jgi:hypothetical protein